MSLTPQASDESASFRSEEDSPQRDTRWFQDPEKTQTAVCVAALCGLLLLFFSRLWWPGLVLIKRDAFRYFPPIKQYMADRLLAGELPQWFPYEALGRSFIGSAAAGLFHPFTFLYLLMPAHEALRLTTLLSCLAAGIGAFALGRYVKFSRTAALVAGIAFACSGYLVSMTDAFIYLYSISLLPLFVLALDKTLAGHAVWSVAAAGIWASVFLNGDMQYGYYYGFVALLWCVMRADGHRRQAALLVGGLALITALIAGIQLAPSAAAFLASERMDPSAFHESAVSWSAHPFRLLTMVISPIGQEVHEPDIAHFFFGNPPTDQVFTGLWSESLYVGLPLIVLAVTGAWYRQDLRPLLVLALLCAWLALGRYGGLYEAFYHTVPFWSAFRYPEKLMGIVTFSLAMLAGAGVDVWCGGAGKPKLWFILGAACVVVWGILQVAALNAWLAGFSGAPVALVREMTDFSARSVALTGPVLVGIGAAVLAYRRGWLPHIMMVGVLVGLLTLDLARANYGAYHTGPVEAATFTPGLATAIERHWGAHGLGAFRIFSNPEASIPYPALLQPMLNLSGVSSLMLRQSLQADINASLGIESINVYMVGQSTAISNLRDLVTKDAWMKAYARFNVAYFIGLTHHFTGPMFDRAVVAVVPRYEVALVKNLVRPSPRTYVSRLPQHASSPVELTSLMENKEFLNGMADVIEGPEDELPGPSTDGKAMIQGYKPEEIQIHTETSRPAALILSDAYEAGWQARLEDGRELPIHRANALVRAVTVPAGIHTVTFSYRTPFLVVGACLSVLGLMICVGMMIVSRRLRLTPLR